MPHDPLYDLAVDLLAKRDYSSGDLRRYLSQKGGKDDVEIVMNTLLSHHRLDDYSLAEKEINKQINKLHGISRIKQELRQKGLDPLVIEQAIENTDVDWVDLCLQAKEKKFGDKLPKNQSDKAKMIRYLQYRGHTMSAIMECIK